MKKPANKTKHPAASTTGASNILSSVKRFGTYNPMETPDEEASANWNVQALRLALEKQKLTKQRGLHEISWELNRAYGQKFGKPVPAWVLQNLSTDEIHATLRRALASGKPLEGDYDDVQTIPPENLT